MADTHTCPMVLVLDVTRGHAYFTFGLGINLKYLKRPSPKRFKNKNPSFGNVNHIVYVEGIW